MIATKFRNICTEIPNIKEREVIETISLLESHQSNMELPVVWDRAEGFQIFDRWGNMWIDMTSSIFVTNAGHNSENNKKFIQDTIDKGLLHAYCYPTVERAEFLKKLISLTPEYLEKASLASTGTEASERALKLARMYNLKETPDKNIIVGGVGNYHGKTMGALMSATTSEARNWVGYQDPNMVQIPFPYPWIIEESGIDPSELFINHLRNLEEKGLNLDQICAMIIEPYQGWGAVFYPVDYIQKMFSWCKQRDVLFIADEIQSGFGRTGKLFAYQHYDVEPDLVICGKGISGGLPVSAVLGRTNIIELDPSLTSTHGGHPLSCAGALGNLIDFEKANLVTRAEKLGSFFKLKLDNLRLKFPDKISRIEGNGMVWGIYFVNNEGKLDVTFVDKMVDKLLQKGVFSIRTGRGVIKLGPPLTIPQDALEEAIDVHEEVINELINETNN